ncbi:hypothetical protein AAFF_G00217360 [Aldrovandia affinis]|uniref:Lebercilin domain-containing protein n=1 Tax=Aldrovandia affinis TaxID=143900 RepID=A0AAD7WUF8_9TELE|nr:hypothetical protein AAFF_G00217360 [Aldrovandia affinis]
MHQSYEDNRDAELSRQSQRSLGKNSEVSLKTKLDKNAGREQRPLLLRRVREPDPSDRSRSLSPCSRSTSPGPRKKRPTNQVSSRPVNRKGVQRAGSKPPPRPRVNSQSLNKVPSPKDLDLVTKRVLSARLLKINEQRNELSELQLRLDQLQRENKALRQLQLRQERALHKFEDTENEVAQLISRHNSEAHVLRERLRRAQEHERATDRRLRDADAQLRRAKAALQKLRALTEDRHLGEREELARKLALAQARTQDDERRIKDLERNMELSGSSHQRHLATERRKTLEVQEEVRNLREELERVTQKLKEKERELDTKNIYANRMARAAPKKEMDSSTKKKGRSSEGPTRNSSKGVQTEDRISALDFPSPPPAVADGPECPKEDCYFSLKELQEEVRSPRVTEEECRSPERERESEEKRQEHHTREEKVFRMHELEAEEEEKEEEDRKRHGQMALQKEESRKGRSPSLFHVQRSPEERKGTNQDRSPDRQEEERHRKEQLLAKMREIDQNTDAFSDFAESKAVRPAVPEERRLPEEAGGPGRRGLRPQSPSEDLAFGSYAPSFGRPAGRPAQRASGGRAEEKPREALDLDAGKEKDKKSNLMQQLFGPSSNNNAADTSSKMEVLSPPPASKAAQQNGSPFPWETAKRREESQPARAHKSPLHVAESRPTVKAIGSFDDDIEELTL